MYYQARDSKAIWKEVWRSEMPNAIPWPPANALVCLQRMHKQRPGAPLTPLSEYQTLPVAIFEKDFDEVEIRDETDPGDTPSTPEDNDVFSV